MSLSRPPGRGRPTGAAGQRLPDLRTTERTRDENSTSRFDALRCCDFLPRRREAWVSTFVSCRVAGHFSRATRQLRQVLLNLVLNGVQAVGACGGRRVIELDAENRPDGGSDRAGSGRRHPTGGDGTVRRAFYTRRRGGSGLGLAIAERFVEAQGGISSSPTSNHTASRQGRLADRSEAGKITG